MKKALGLIIIVCFGIFSSCSDGYMVDPITECNVTQFDDVGISPEQKTLSASDASIVSKIYLSGGKFLSRGCNIVDQGIVAMRDSMGEPLFYGVNSDRGVVFVSAKKTCAPVLGFAPNAIFDGSDTGLGLDLLLEEYVRDMAISATQPVDSSLLREWAFYEKLEPVRMGESRGSSTAMTDARGDLAGNLRGLGYDTYYLYRLAENNDVIPQDILNNFIAISQSEDYWEGTGDDGLHAGVVAVRYTTSVKQDPLIKTNWSNGPPFEMIIPEHPKIGCTTIAAAQIMNYHRWPTNIPWSEFPYMMDYTDYYSRRYESFENFLDGLYFNIGVDKETGGATITDVKYALERYYSYRCYISANLFYQGQPIFTSGTSASNGIGHAWVIDGIDQYVKQTEYVLFLPHHSHYPDFVYEEAARDAYSPSATTYYHMNWGWGGKYDGWYLNSNLSKRNSGTSANTDFTRYREYMVISKKVK